MPIVIKELVITTTVDAQLTTESAPTTIAPEQAQQQLIQACVEQVLRVLQEREER